jgi:cystinosin
MQFIDGLYFLSSIKAIITLIKYAPQVYLNYKRKSTIGWSIENIMLDFMGGFFSNLQMITDAINLNDVSAIFGNPVKIWMGTSSIIFDIVFLYQHFMLYPHRKEETDPLLGTNYLENGIHSQDFLVFSAMD